MAKLTRIVAGGTGLIGQHLINRWCKKDLPVTLVTRNKAHAQKLFPTLEHIITWDELNEEALLNASCVINLAGENIGAKAWTDNQKQVILQSRIETTLKISELCAGLGVEGPRLLNASAIGIYGLHDGKKNKLPKTFNEDSKLEPGIDFLSEVAERWEKATVPASKAGVNVVNMRFGVVLSDQGGALPEFVRIAKSFVACPINDGYQPFSWIHIIDVCAAIEKILEHPEISGPVNFVTPEAITQGEFLKTLCHVLHKPYWPKPFWHGMFNFMLQKMLGETKMDSLLVFGQNVKPNVLLKLHFDYTYPRIESALKQLYG